MRAALEKRKPVPLRAGTGFEGSLAADTEDNRPGAETQENWGRRHPMARWAHRAMESALRTGIIDRGPCEDCGAVHGVDGVIVDGHHDPKAGGYDRPLASIRWKCRRHHRQEHARLRRQEGGDE